MSIADLAAMSVMETRRANAQLQRVIIDPITGDVSGLMPAAESSAFDVAADGSSNDAASETATPSETAQETPPATPEAKTSAYEPLRRNADGDAPLPAIPRSVESLVGAPAPEITETLGPLALPKRGEKDARAASLYARAFARQEDQRLVAVVVTDAGFSEEALRLILALPMEVTVAVSPYATDSAKQIEALRNSGHEVWSMLPAAGARYPQDDPGPLGLIAALSKREALMRLHRIFSATLGSVGVILPADETISAQPQLWTAILDEIDRRGLYLLSTHPTRGLEQLSPAAEKQAIMRRASMVLDSTPGAAFIRSKLAAVKTAAANDGELVVLTSARPQSLRILSEWLQDQPLADTATLAPLSAIYAEIAPPIPEMPADAGGHGGGEEKSDDHGGGH